MALLLAFDNLLTNLRLRLRGQNAQYPTDDGPELRNGVTVDRALDAAGNYVRHEHEWQLHDYRATFPQGQQLRSIIAIARLSTAMPIDDDDAEEAYAQYTLTDPGPMILDLLSGYEEKGQNATYEDVEEKLKFAGLRTIEVTFERRRGARGATTPE